MTNYQFNRTVYRAVRQDGFGSMSKQWQSKVGLIVLVGLFAVLFMLLKLTIILR